MNRSYSKIRHIQESNLRLEKRFLSEQSTTTATTATTTTTTINPNNSGSASTNEFFYFSKEHPEKYHTGGNVPWNEGSENLVRYAKYIGNTVESGGKITRNRDLKSIYGKQIILYKSPQTQFNNQSEESLRVVPTLIEKSAQSDKHVYIYTDSTEKVKKPFIMLVMNDVTQAKQNGRMIYKKDYKDGGSYVYNSVVYDFINGIFNPDLNPSITAQPNAKG